MRSIVENYDNLRDPITGDSMEYGLSCTQTFLHVWCNQKFCDKGKQWQLDWNLFVCVKTFKLLHTAKVLTFHCINYCNTCRFQEEMPYVEDLKVRKLILCDGELLSDFLII